MVIKVKRRSRQRKKLNIKKFFMALTAVIFLIFIAFMVMPEPSYKECFHDLAALQRYAKDTNENTPMENNDTLRPEFTKYYQSLSPTSLQKIKNKAIWLLSKINLIKPPAWDISAFKILLEDLGSTRQKSGMKDSYVYRIQTQSNSKIVVFGNLQGSLHSFVRSLTKLKELGIIDDSLKITQPQNYIFLMGDVINRSPFTLETLTATMRLTQVNPNNFIYLRGNHEDNSYWQEHTLKTELQIRAKNLSRAATPFELEVSTFFNSLSIAAYLTIPNAANDFIRLSDQGRQDSTILNETNFADILTKNTVNSATYFSVKEGGTPSSTKINIKAIIRGEKKRKTFQKNEGLRLLAPDVDSVAWNVLSCPNVVYQKALDFYFDAFAVITTAENLNDWVITLYNRDLRTNDPFKETKYNFISGLNAETHKKIDTTPTQAHATPPAQQSEAPQQLQSQAPAKELPAPASQQQTPQNVMQQNAVPQQDQTQPPATIHATQTLSTPPQQSTPATQQPQQLLQVIPETEQEDPQTQQPKQPNQTNNTTATIPEPKQ
ncbi:MAG: hypothetical protein US49_C0001G0020 [candidate division TM6 bacterium GW2011_GWF2_37_49]|nr:MAG: hypothetical protein US49_C0001G0020 [candidate division TM6 bacterium GW2011_GWF2_37_49]